MGTRHDGAMSASRTDPPPTTPPTIPPTIPPAIPPETGVVADRLSEPRFGRLDLLWLVLGPVSLAVAGATHPSPLSADNAAYWRTLHVVMLPLFPLLAVMVWVLLRGVHGGVDGVLGWAARLLALVYAAFYSALDVLAGIANGAIVERAATTGQDVSAIKSLVFGQASEVGDIGVYALLAAAVLVGVVHLRHSGVRAAPGALVLVAAAWSFLASHVYPWRGVLTMLAFGVGALLLAWPVLSQQRRG